MRYCLIALLTLCSLATRCAAAETTLTLLLDPGSPREAEVIAEAASSRVVDGTRRAEPPDGWTYRLVLPPNARAALALECPANPAVTITTAAGKAVPAALERAGGTLTVRFSSPAGHPVGSALMVALRARSAPLEVRTASLQVRLPDTNGDGLSDFVESLMGVPKGAKANASPVPAKPRTSFQTGDRYSPAIHVPTDAVLVYSADPAVYRTWSAPGYILQTMGGFRDGLEYLREHPNEVQRDRSGTPIVIGEHSYYMVPTPERNRRSAAWYLAAIAAGSTAIAPEEPEYWTKAGYEEPFKQAWQARYGSPWEPPHSSISARYRSEQLKGEMTRTQIETILNEAQRATPNVTRMVAIHSAITYYHWGIALPHYGLAALPALEEIIGQVWTGTARTATRAAGLRAERTFELGYLEYSSLYQLVRGTQKRIWFLMDPVEDNPDLPTEDYHRNYLQTLVAALQFPVDRFEVMPWPQRIYGRVPAAYATTINTVVGALAELWRYPDSTFEAGTDGIGTFVADSMAWQRGDPFPSDMDGFYALSVQLVDHGVPVQVLPLERVTEPRFLDRFKVLLLSYDYLKPASPEINRALADWVRRGGALLAFGGTDAYNELPDSWWRKAGLASPLQDLLGRLSLPAGVSTVSRSTAPAQAPVTLLTGDGKERSLRNRRPYTLDLTPFVRSSGGAVITFKDVAPEDGWGPYLTTAELRVDGKIAAAFRAGSEIETRFLSDDNDSRLVNGARFADGTGSWTYRFENLPRDKSVTLTLDIGNGFLVEGAPLGPPPPLLVAATTDADRRVARVRLQERYPLTRAETPSNAVVHYRLEGDGSPVVWEARVGNGTFMHVGVAPGSLSATAQTSLLLRSLARIATAHAGQNYTESNAFIARRGPYVAVRALARDQDVPGRFVDLLDPKLPIVENPMVPARGTAFLLDAGARGSIPRLLAASGRVRATSNQAGSTAFLVQAPTGTTGAARLESAGRRLSSAQAWSTLGTPIPVQTEMQGASVLLRYANRAEGVVVRAAWAPR